MSMSEAGEALGFEGTYPLDEHFWVPGGQDTQYPLRFGDLASVPSSEQAAQDSKGKPWFAAMVVHPNCDLGPKGAPLGVQVVRVHPLKKVSVRQRAEIVAGFTVDEAGAVRVARINFVYLAGVPGSATHSEPMFADLRETVRISLANLAAAGRLAAMTHEARVAILARDALFRYRWNLTPVEVYKLERARISNDPRFEGPKPLWATSD